jgi:Flp pilus assembly protein TadD
VNAGEIQIRLGNPAAAEQFFLRAAKVDPNDVEALNQLGLLAAGQQQNARAKEWFQKAIALKRDYAGAINNLGVLYLQMGQANDAIAAFEYGIGVAPQEQDLYLNLGRLYVTQGRRDKAREVMQRLLEQKPDSAAAAKAIRDLESR